LIFHPSCCHFWLAGTLPPFAYAPSCYAAELQSLATTSTAGDMQSIGHTKGRCDADGNKKVRWEMNKKRRDSNCKYATIVQPNGLSSSTTMIHFKSLWTEMTQLRKFVDRGCTLLLQYLHPNEFQWFKRMINYSRGI
jgi:hypothetical protein